MKRRIFLSTFAAGAATASWGYAVEPHQFEVTHTEVRAPGIRPRRILHLSDLHISDGMTAEELERGFRLGLREKPDLICLTGDFVSGTLHGYEGFDRPGLERLLRLAADAAPTFAVLGNHDGGAWLERTGRGGSVELVSEMVSRSGVNLLGNQASVLGEIQLVGVHDLWSGLMDAERAFSGSSTAPYTLLLNHNPDAKRHFVANQWDLMLCGHTHGGQGRIPGLPAYWAPVHDKQFLAGLYHWEQRKIFITRGIGSPHHVRINCPPEISVLHLG